MCKVSSTSPLENLFVNVRVAAHTASTKLEQIRGESQEPIETLLSNVRVVALTASSKIEQIREDTQRAVTLKRQRAQRTKQAAIFAEEEARLHEQLMIEQEIFERQQRQAATTAAKSVEPTQQAKQEEPTRVVLAPRSSPKQARRVDAIEQKLAMIRQTVAPSKNAAGIASLQAAFAGI